MQTEKVVTLTIDIERSSFAGYSANYQIKEMLFTSYDNLIKTDDILHVLKKCMAKIERFDMLTVSVEVRPDRDYSNNASTMIESFRFLNRYDKLEYSRFRVNRYGEEPHTENGWQETTKKKIFDTVTALCDTANRSFITALKERNVEAA
jgi:hypothetical protein